MAFSSHKSALTVSFSHTSCDSSIDASFDTRRLCRGCGEEPTESSPRTDSPSPPANSAPWTFEVKAELGVGGHGVVVHSHLPLVGDVAVKVLPLADDSTSLELHVMKVLRQHPHPHVIATHPILSGETEVFLPMELCDSDMLTQVQTYGPLSERRARVLFGQVVSALQHCEGLGIYHGDVKPDNLLVVRGLVVLSDFGSAKLQRRTSKPCGTMMYGAPKAVVAKPSHHDACSAAHSSLHASLSTSLSTDAVALTPGSYSASKADVWSLGITLAATLACALPWAVAHTSNKAFALWQDIVAACSVDGRQPLQEVWRLLFAQDACRCEGFTPTPLLLSLLCGMLHPNPADRLSMAEVAAHAWFTAD